MTKERGFPRFGFFVFGSIYWDFKDVENVTCEDFSFGCFAWLLV